MDSGTETDAVPEEILVTENVNQTPCDLGSLRINGRLKQQTAVKTEVPPPPDAACGDVMNRALTWHQYLEDDDTDILILHADEDLEAAEELKNRITKNVKINIGTQTSPRVCRLDDMIAPGRDQIASLDYAVSKTLFVFLYVTEEFCKNCFNILQSNSCLQRALNGSKERWTVIPVHTCSKQNRNYELPMMLNSLRPLNSFVSSFEKDVKKLLEHKSKIILERMTSKESKLKQGFNEAKLQQCKTVNSMVTNENATKMYLSLESSGFSSEQNIHDIELQNRALFEVQKKSFVSAFHSSFQQEQQPRYQQQENQHSVFSAAETSGKSHSSSRSRNYGTENCSSSITTDSPSDTVDSGDNNTSFSSFQPETLLSHGERQSKSSFIDKTELQDNVFSGTLATTLRFSSLPEAEDNKAFPCETQEAFDNVPSVSDPYTHAMHAGLQTQQMSNRIRSGMSNSPTDCECGREIQENRHKVQASTCFDQSPKAGSGTSAHTFNSPSCKDNMKNESRRPFRDNATQTKNSGIVVDNEGKFNINKVKFLVVNSTVNFNSSAEVGEDSDDSAD